MERRKYPEVKGPYWVYVHQTPDKNCYFGYSSCKNCYERWSPRLYKNNSELNRYIEEYGWDSINHRVIVDGIATKEDAIRIEGWFIEQCTRDGFCLNRIRSGYCWKDDPEGYMKDRYQSKRDELITYYRDRYSTPEGKIYYRVAGFNTRHPELAIETALEAKQKYLETGYIPDYIKNKDLK